jgi:hypothetical protein
MNDFYREVDLGWYDGSLVHFIGLNEEGLLNSNEEDKGHNY